MRRIPRRLAPRRPAAASLLLIVLVLGLAVRPAAAGPAPADDRPVARATGIGTYCAEPEELAFLRIVNDYRAANGQPALVLSFGLSDAAEHHSVDMATFSYWHGDHSLFDGTSWSVNIRNHGYDPDRTAFLGENIAAGYADAQSTFTQWKNSPGHNANMLGANYRAIGIGRAYNAASTYRNYWTTTFGSEVDAPVTCGVGTTAAPPTATPGPSSTAAAPTATPRPTNTVPAPTVTPRPTNTAAPTVPPTAPPAPTTTPRPTNTPAAATATARPTNTPLPPTATAQATGTSIPAATSTPRPSATATTAAPSTATAAPTGQTYRIAVSGRTSNSNRSTYAYDGRTSTAWVTTADYPRSAYVFFDLGSVRRVRSIQWVFAQGGWADDWQIQVSTDKQTWTTLANRGNAKPGTWQTQTTDVPARFVRFVFVNPNNDRFLGSVAEVRITG